MDLKKCRMLGLLLVGISLTAPAGCVARRTKAALLSYDQALKPGMTRRDVEDYLRANKVSFGRMYSSHGYPSDDFVDIGMAHYPLPCGDESYYVVFVFNNQSEHVPETNSHADDLDTLQSITTSHDIDCF